MKVRVLSFVLLLACTPLQAVAGSLAGQVTRSDTDAPVAGALVKIRGTALVAITNAEGLYDFPAVPNGTYGLTCAAAGLRGTNTGALWIGDDASHDFALTPPSDIGTIQGIANCGANPCQGVIISAHEGNNMRAVTLSRPGGDFVLPGLAAGEYELRGACYGYLPESFAVDIAAPATDGGTTVVERNIVLGVGGPFTLSGVVALSDNPLDRSGSTVRCNGQEPALNTTTNTGGSYRLENVPAGPLSFTAYRSGYRSDSRIDFMMTSNRSLNFVLQKEGNGSTEPTYRIEGTVNLVVPDGGSAPGLAGSHVSIWSAEGNFKRQTLTDSEGAFSIGGLEQGSYKAGASREGFISQVEGPFAVSADRGLNFSLEADPVYDWGPGVDAPDTGCGCDPAVPQSCLPLLVLAALLVLRRWIR